MLVDDWDTLARTLLVAPLAYLALVVVVRVSGKRALAKLNAFDFVITVSLGSVLASIAVSPDVSLASGVAALGVLVGLQFAIALLSARVRRFQRLVKARPVLLVRNGAVLEEALHAERVTRSEVLQALRQHGMAAVEDCAALVLETDGTMSVLTQRPKTGGTSTLTDVAGGT